MTVVEYETWVLWIHSNSSTTHGKCDKDWINLPQDIKNKLIEGYLTGDLQR